MPNFNYKAVNDSGKLIKGAAIALDEFEVERNLNQDGYTLISVKPIKQSILTQLTAGRVKIRAQVEFYHRLAQTLEIGLPILSALEENGNYLPSTAMRTVSKELKTAVEGGRSLYEAMKAHPKVFGKLELAIIRMGEQSGVLPDCLKQLAAFLQWKEELQAQVKKASIYPAIVISAIVVVIAVWIGSVLPKMVNMLVEMDVAIPAVTQVIIKISTFFQVYWLWLLGWAIAVPLAVYLWQKTKSGGLLFHQYLLKIPLLGNVLRNVALSRLCRNFATMFGSGMAIQQIFTTLADNGLGNRWLEDRFLSAFKGIERGESMGDALQATGAFPSLLIGAVRNGEATGTIDNAFERLGNYFDEEVKRTVDLLVNAIGPMAIVALGTVFGTILISILLPLYDIFDTINKAY